MNKTNTVVIAILSVMVVFLGGLVIYNGYINKNNNVVSDDTVKDNNEERTNNDSSNTDIISVHNDNDNYINKFIGSYSYEGELSDDKNVKDSDITDDAWTSGKMAYESLKLNVDGTAEAGAGNNRAGGYSAKGKWYVSNNEIIIFNELCNPIVLDNKVEYPNCWTIWTYKYELKNDNIIITSNNNTATTVVLNKQ